MPQKMGYLVDLSTVSLDDSTHTSWIQAMPIGKYSHPVYGDIDITAERVSRFADNVNNNVRQTELDIDYDHKAVSGEAAGWVKKAEARADGLWVFVEWTKEAAAKIKAKAYRYFSPEFDDTWTHPKTKVKFQDVLFGGGITNRPFLKDILPLNLSEAFEEANDKTNEGAEMSDALKQVKDKLGLKEDATDEEVLAALDAKEQEQTPEPITSEKQEEQEQEQLVPQLSEIKKLAENNPAVAGLLAVVEAQGAQLSEATKQLKEGTVSATVTRLSEKAAEKGYALPPTVKDELKKALSESPSKQFSDALVSSFEKLIEVGIVKMSEDGHTRRDDTENDPVKKFNDEVAKQMEAKKLSYSDAVVLVSSEKPDLFNEYRAGSYAGRE